MLAAAVVALAGEPLGVFVGEDGALRLHHGAGSEVLGSDELEVGLLTLALLSDEAGDGRIRLGQVSIDGAAGDLAHWNCQSCVRRS